MWITARGVSGVSGSVLCRPEVGGYLPEEGRRGGVEPQNQFGWSVQDEMTGKLEEWGRSREERPSETQQLFGIHMKSLLCEG